MTNVNPTFLVAVDGSDPSRRAVEYAARLAGHMSPKGRLEIVTVLDLSRLDVYDGFYLTDEQLEKVRHKVQAQALAQAEAAAKAVAADLEISTELLEGKTDAAILGAVHGHVSAVVVGKSGKDGVERLLFGSIPRRLLEQANVPVIVVP